MVPVPVARSWSGDHRRPGQLDGVADAGHHLAATCSTADVAVVPPAPNRRLTAEEIAV